MSNTEEDRFQAYEDAADEGPIDLPYLDSLFGYIPGEDRCPTANRILENEAFLTNAELATLITCHPTCRVGLLD
jgi:hypothetical protein